MSVPLDLDQLQSFCAIADCGSFTEAARRVNKTQSAVSMQIKRLEERLGHALLSRDGRTVTLTQHGEALYSRARKMLKVNAEIMDEFSDEDLSGAIRFGLPDDYAVRLLPVILSSFQKTHPKIMIDVTCASSQTLLEGMKVVGDLFGRGRRPVLGEDRLGGGEDPGPVAPRVRPQLLRPVWRRHASHLPRGDNMSPHS